MSLPERPQSGRDMQLAVGNELKNEWNRLIRPPRKAFEAYKGLSLALIPSYVLHVAFRSGCELLGMSGHTSESLGPLVIQIGGMRNDLSAEDLLHVLVVDLRRQRIARPRLAPDSTRPLQRMRHASCVVQAPLPESAFRQAILLLGGHDANTRATRPLLSCLEDVER